MLSLKWFVLGVVAAVLLAAAANACSYYFRTGTLWGLSDMRVQPQAIGFPFEIWNSTKIHAGTMIDVKGMVWNIASGIGIGGLLGLIAMFHRERLEEIVSSMKAAEQRKLQRSASRQSLKSNDVQLGQQRNSTKPKHRQLQFAEGAGGESSRRVQISVKGLLILMVVAAVVAMISKAAFEKRPGMLMLIFLSGPAILIMLSMVPIGLSWQQRLLILTPAAVAMLVLAVYVGRPIGLTTDHVLMGIFVTWVPQSVFAAMAIASVHLFRSVVY
jgi:hypothetical protein